MVELYADDTGIIFEIAQVATEQSFRCKALAARLVHHARRWTHRKPHERTRRQKGSQPFASEITCKASQKP